MWKGIWPSALRKFRLLYYISRNAIMLQHFIIKFALYYSCFEYGSLTVEKKLTRQCRKLLWVMMVSQLLDWTWRFFSAVEGHITNTCIHCFSFLVAESPWNSIKRSHTLTTHNTNRYCRVRFYTFVGKPVQTVVCQLSGRLGEVKKKLF